MSERLVDEYDVLKAILEEVVLSRKILGYIRDSNWEIRDLLTPRLTTLSVYSGTMSANNQTFPGTAPVTFTATGKDQFGNPFPIDPTTVVWSFSTSSGDPGTFSGDVLTPAPVGGVGVVTATVDSISGTDDVTIDAQAPKLAEVDVTGS